MRLFRRNSSSRPLTVVVDVLILLVGAAIVSDLLLAGVLLINPQHPLREWFQVTTLVGVPASVWPVDGVVRVDARSADAIVDPWAFVKYRPTGRAFVSVTMIGALAWWACVLTVAVQLRRVLANVTPHAPFPRANVRAIRRVGAAILGMAVVDEAIDFGLVLYMRATTTVAGGPPVIPTEMLVADFPVGTFLAGFAVLVLAGIFRAGADLQDDQVLTI